MRPSIRSYGRGRGRGRGRVATVENTLKDTLDASVGGLYMKAVKAIVAVVSNSRLLTQATDDTELVDLQNNMKNSQLQKRLQLAYTNRRHNSISRRCQKHDAKCILSRHLCYMLFANSEQGVNDIQLL